MPLSRLLDTLRADLFGVSERGRMVRSAGATAALKVGSTALAFGASLLYARTLGPHGYGLFAYVMAWVTLLAIPVGMGLPTYLIREGAKISLPPKRLRRWADARVLASGVLAALLMASVLLLPQAAGARWLFVIAAPLPLLNSLGSVRQSLMQAHGAVARSQWPNWILAPALTIAALLVVWAWRGSLHPTDLMAATLGAAVFALAINQLQLRRIDASGGADTGSPHAIRVRAALPFLWLGMLWLLNSRADLIMLGSMKGAHDAGIYAVATRAAGLIPFLALAANKVLAPRIAKLHHDGDHQQLQRLLTGSARRIFALSAPLAIVLIVAAGPLLRLFYGAQFEDAALPLQILALGQLFNVLSGSTGLILNMTGHETLAARGMIMSVVLNIILNAALIPFYGIMGAALATGTSMIVLNALLWSWIRRRLRLRPSLLNV